MANNGDESSEPCSSSQSNKDKDVDQFSRIYPHHHKKDEKTFQSYFFGDSSSSDGSREIEPSEDIGQSFFFGDSSSSEGGEKPTQRQRSYTTSLSPRQGKKSKISNSESFFHSSSSSSEDLDEV